jgi:hypothetical protein
MYADGEEKGMAVALMAPNGGRRVIGGSESEEDARAAGVAVRSQR